MNQQEQYEIFYSWQSDLDEKKNRYFIITCLDQAIKNIKKENSITVNPRIEHSTKGKTGSPDISETIFSKIDACQIFVADVTTINNSIIQRLASKRRTPNPNILIELGYAVNRLGWERVICVHNNNYGKVEILPFDLRSQRILQYSIFKPSAKKTSKDELTNALAYAIKIIIDQYPQLEEKSRANQSNQHDLNIFQGFDEILNDTDFRDLLQDIADNIIILKSGYRKLNNLRNYLNADRNEFINKRLKETSVMLSEALQELYLTLVTNLFSTPSTHNLISDDPNEDPQYRLPQREHSDNDYEYQTTTHNRVDLITKAVENCYYQYKLHRATVKEILFI